MSPLWLIYLIIPVLIGFFVAEHKRDILKLIRVQFSNIDLAETKKNSEKDLLEWLEDKSLGHEYEAVIFVPSARENFDKRAAIRSSWLGQITTNSNLSRKVLLKFVVGGLPCKIHPDDRVNLFTCDEWNVDIPDSRGDVAAVEEVDGGGDAAGRNHVYGIQSLPFTVHFPIILSKLGVFRECVSNGANVRLLEASTQREIVSATFSKDSTGVLIGNFRYKAVEPYYLPKGFEGVIVGEGLNIGNSRLSTTKWNQSKVTRTNNSSGIIHFSQDDPLPDGHYEDVRKWNSTHVHIVSFIYNIHEYDELKKHVQSKATRKEIWQKNYTRETLSLADEMENYEDIMTVGLVDVYRNIPKKFLQFAEWVTKATTLKFNFLIKTDDDCFLDVVRILNRLETLKGATKTWLGRFRHNWLVEKHGKWAEKEYPSALYPKFACGSGYVLTADLMHWIARNAKSLKPYQGEDVSLGIWMAAIGPNYVDEPLWQCEKDCLSNMYSMPELRQDEMHRVWTELITCGDPCGCN